MKIKILKKILLCVGVLLLTSCKLILTVDSGGQIISDSGGYNCNGESCTSDIPYEGLNETFTAVPDEGCECTGWEGWGPCEKEVKASCTLDIDPVFAAMEEDVELIARFQPEASNAPLLPKTQWMLVALPDTQYYSQSYSWVFDAQTEWIAANVEALNIRFVVHEGDVTNTNTVKQWVNARASMDNLTDAGIPFAIAPGNHDYGSRGKTADRTSYLNEYFSPRDYTATDTLLLYESGHIDNSAHIFSVDETSFLVLALEFGPRDDVVRWADDVLSAHPNHTALLVTHAYMYHNNTRYSWGTYGSSQKWSPYSYGVGTSVEGINDGEDLWQQLVAKHPRMIMVMSGHVLGDGKGYLASKGNHGNVVHQLLANYQDGRVGGGGFLRLYEFQDDGKTIKVRTYSPYLDEWLDDPQNEFTLTIDSGGRDSGS